MLMRHRYGKNSNASRSRSTGKHDERVGAAWSRWAGPFSIVSTAAISRRRPARLCIKAVSSHHVNFPGGVTERATDRGIGTVGGMHSGLLPSCCLIHHRTRPAVRCSTTAPVFNRRGSASALGPPELDRMCFIDSEDRITGLANNALASDQASYCLQMETLG